MENKLLRSLRSDWTGEKRAVSPPVELVGNLAMVPDSDLYGQTQRLYEISVGLKYRVACEPEDLDIHMKNMERQITEDMYGDMIGHLLRLEREIYENWDFPSETFRSFVSGSLGYCR